MKQRICLSVIMLPLLLTAATLYAQQASYASAAIATVHLPAVATGIKARAISYVNKTFTNAVDITGYILPDGYVIKFNQQDILCRAGFNKNGRPVNLMRTYTERHLPRHIRKLVNNNYADYSITLVEEITAARQLVYIVHIEDSKRAKKIQVQDDELTEMETFEKTTLKR